MKSFTQGNTEFRYVKVPTAAGEPVKRATGTTDPVTGDLIAAMVEILGSKHQWELLGRVTGKGATLDLATLYGAWVQTPSSQTNRRTGLPMEPGVDERIEHVRMSLNDVKLNPLLDQFEKLLKNGAPIIGGKVEKVASKTVTEYMAAIRTFLPVEEDLSAGFLTTHNLMKWVEDQAEEVEPPTTLKRGRAVNRFTSWLVSKGTIGLNPMDGVTLPPPGDPLCHYIEVHEALALANAQPGQFRLLSATLAGTGLEVAAALSLRRRDVDLKNMEIRAAGTKNYNRDRIAIVAPHMQPFVEEACHNRFGDARLFDTIPEKGGMDIARDRHYEASNVLIAQGMRVFAFYDSEPKKYTMRDQRHTWAVWAVRGGWPLDSVSKQLGHANGILVSKVYGRFQPLQVERARWNAQAALAATERMASIGVKVS